MTTNTPPAAAWRIISRIQSNNCGQGMWCKNNYVVQLNANRDKWSGPRLMIASRIEIPRHWMDGWPHTHFIVLCWRSGVFYTSFPPRSRKLFRWIEQVALKWISINKSWKIISQLDSVLLHIFIPHFMRISRPRWQSIRDDDDDDTKSWIFLAPALFPSYWLLPSKREHWWSIENWILTRI